MKNHRSLKVLNHLSLFCIATMLALVIGRPAEAQYITRNGTALSLNKAPIYFHGATLYGADYQNPTAFRKHIDTWLDNAHKNGLNMIRAVNFYEHTSKWADPTTWECMDYLMSAAQKRGMYVELDLAAYRNMLWMPMGINPYADPSVWNKFLDFVGHRYKNQTNLAFYAIGGEILAPNYGDEPKVSGQKYIDFFKATSDRLHAADPNHLIETGGFLHLGEPKSGIPWKSIFDLPNIKMAAVHVYSDPTVYNNIDVRAAMAVADWARGQHIPFLIEEFGATQGLGDAMRAKMFERRYMLAALTDSVATIFWNLGPEVRNTSYDVNPQTPKTWAAVGAGGTYFRDGFDEHDQKPTWTSQIDSSAGVIGIRGNIKSAPECAVRNETAHSGSGALMFSGSVPAASAHNFCDFKIFRVGMMVQPQTKMRFRLYPQYDNARYVSVDLHCTDGTWLHNTAAVDQNGYSMSASAGHGGKIPLKAWTTIRCDIGRWLRGKVIDKIDIAYDRPNTAGQFRGYIDDILITNGSF